jgi:hypothetical protein
MKRITHHTAVRTVATAAVLLLGVALLPPVASAAGVGGRTTGTESATAGSWGATASVTSMAFNTNTDQTSTVTNTGSIALSAQSYVVTITKPIIFAPTFQIFECAVPWVTNTCSGGAGTQIGGTLASGSTTTITSTTALAAGAAVYLQVEPAGVLFFTTTVTLTSQVTSPAQLRAGIKTNH